MVKYEMNFIPQNKAPQYCDYIHVYNGTGLVGKVKISKLNIPTLGNKIYSFGALADVHVTHNASAMANFKNALNYFNDIENVAFTCIAGDLTSNGTSTQYESYRNAVTAYSQDVPVYACTGNHDVEQSSIAPFLTVGSTQQYTEQNLYYMFTYEDDVFIMFGMSAWSGKTGEIFTDESLQWLYETLEANRNKRCFVFEHCPNMVYDSSTGTVGSESGSGAIVGLPLPTGNLLNTSTAGEVFRSLMAHYHNVIWLHGHSHMEFPYQLQCSHLNYDNKLGCHSVHIPSLAEGRELNADGTGWVFTPGEGYGYVIDVYTNHIVLRGRDFVANKFIPIATFCLNTTLQNIDENTFMDSTGTIITN